MKSFITKSLNWPLAENSATFINFALREGIFCFILMMMSLWISSMALMKGTLKKKFYFLLSKSTGMQE